MIVNPAHSFPDLEFGRRIGLPIRFGLTTTSITCEPETWPNPPIIKDGLSTRTGRFDGLNLSEAIKAYYDALNAGGFAQKVVDHGLPPCKLAVFSPRDGGEVHFDKRHAVFSTASDRPAPKQCSGLSCLGQLAASPLLAEILTQTSPSPTVIVPRGEISSTLLYARLLHLDLKGEPFEPREILALNNAQETKASSNAEEPNIGLALLANAPTAKPVVLKQQIMDQVHRFRTVHQDLIGDTPLEVESPLPDEPMITQLRKVKNALLSRNPDLAFGALYSIQKNLTTKQPHDKIGAGLLKAYRSVAYVLAGEEDPDNLHALESIWHNL